MDNESVSNLFDLLKVCSVCSIDAVVIEDGKIRGLNEAKTCAIISTNKVPDFGAPIGLSRLSALRSRMNLLGADLKLTVKDTRGGEVSNLEMSQGRSKSTYRCTSRTVLVSQNRAPKGIEDEHFSTVDITVTELKLVLDAIRAMGADEVQFSLHSDREVHVKIADSSNDSFALQLAAPHDVTDYGSFRYSAETFISVLKAIDSKDEKLNMSFTAHGILTLDILGYNVFVLPNMEQGD